jgi:galactoside O-acetyltransferase
MLQDFSGLSHRVSVFSATDDYTGAALTNPMVPDSFKKVKHGIVDIQRHAIIGAHSVVMPSVTVSEGCSVGAMSFVTKSTKPWGIYFGSPAKRIKERKKDLLELEGQFLYCYPDIVKLGDPDEFGVDI